MGQTTLFDFATFMACSEEELAAYATNILLNGQMSEVCLNQLAEKLNSFDDFHLVHAIELGVEFSPSRFLQLIPNFLTHKSQAVRFAVHRQLSAQKPGSISEELIRDCQQLAMQGRLADDVADIVKVLIAKRMSGN